MEITIVCSIDPEISTKPGGTRSYTMNLLNFLCSQGIKTTLIGTSRKNKSVDYPFHFIPVTQSEKISSYKFLFFLIIKPVFLKIPRSSIIHTQRPDHMLPFTIFNGRNPKICTLHGAPSKAISFKKNFVISFIYDLIETFVLNRVDKIIAVDEESMAYYIKKYPYLKSKMALVTTGVDTNLFKTLDINNVRNKFGFRENEKIILYVGRIEKEKGIDIAIKSFKKINEHFNNIKMVIVGNGNYCKELKALAKNLGITNIEFISQMDHNEIPEIMNCANVFLLCSLYEGMPTVVLEALACGVPVVSTNVGDTKKVVKDNNTGYIINKSKEEDIIDKLTESLLSADNFKKNCIKTAHEYSWQKTATRILRIYNEILKKE